MLEGLRLNVSDLDFIRCVHVRASAEKHGHEHATTDAQNELVRWYTLLLNLLCCVLVGLFNEEMHVRQKFIQVQVAQTLDYARIRVA